MKLTELEPRFIKVIDEKMSMEVDDILQADGVEFLCPKCFVHNGGPVGTHVVICWAPHVPAERAPGPGRWSLHGTGYHDLSLVAGSSSVWLKSSWCHEPSCPNWHGYPEGGGPPCTRPECAGWHGFVTSGEVTSV